MTTNTLHIETHGEQAPCAATLSNRPAARASVTREVLWVALAALLALLLTVACGKGDGGGDEGLGISSELGPRLDPDGNALPEDFHPLSRTHRTIAPLAELYYAGVTLNGKSQGLLDDQKADYARLHAGDEESWTQAPMAAGKGDVDGDGYDEIVVAYYNSGEGVLKMRVIDRQGDTYVESTYIVAEGLSLGNATSYDLPPMLAVAVGDLDADGRDEVAVGIANQLYLVEDAQAGHMSLGSVTYDAPGDSGLAMLQLGFGDFNGDTKQQLMVSLSLADAAIESGRVNWYRYDSHSLEEASASGELTLDIDYDRHVFNMARMAVADIDGDGLSEAVFNAAGPTGHYVFFMDDEKADSAVKGAHALSTTWKLGMAIAALDAKGDGVAEIAASDALLKYSPNTGEWTRKGTLPLEPIDEECSFLDLFGWCIGTWNPIYKPANALTEVYATGDFNGDYRAEVAVRRDNTLQVWGLDENGACVPRTAHMSLGGQPSRTPALVGANTDNDSLVVRFTGQRELLFSNPKVVAVMAAPPTWANKGQNVDGSGTTFGRMNGTEVEKSESYGFMVGHSIGFSQEFSVLGVANAGSFEIKASFEHAFNWSTMHASAIETSYAFSSGPGEDKVVFTSIPYDVYYYEVISSPDASGVGEIISINVPRQPQTLAVTREFYNAHNGDSPDIDDSVLGHTVGNPWSYPTQTDKNDLMAERGGWVNETMVSVGEGAGAAELTIASTETTAHGMSYDFDASVEVEVGVVGVTAGVAAGFHFGTEYSVSASQGFFVAGTIGEIPADQFSAGNSYRVGLFAYPHQTADGHEFLVVNYWVAE